MTNWIITNCIIALIYLAILSQCDMGEIEANIGKYVFCGWTALALPIFCAHMTWTKCNLNMNKEECSVCFLMIIFLDVCVRVSDQLRYVACYCWLLECRKADNGLLELCQSILIYLLLMMMIMITIVLIRNNNSKEKHWGFSVPSTLKSRSRTKVSIKLSSEHSHLPRRCLTFIRMGFYIFSANVSLGKFLHWLLLSC